MVSVVEDITVVVQEQSSLKNMLYIVAAAFAAVACTVVALIFCLYMCTRTHASHKCAYIMHYSLSISWFLAAVIQGSAFLIAFFNFFCFFIHSAATRQI